MHEYIFAKMIFIAVCRQHTIDDLCYGESRIN